MILSRYKVRERMNTLGMENYTDVTRAGGPHQNTIYGVLDSDNWNSKTLSKIAVALQCSPFELITIEDDSN